MDNTLVLGGTPQTVGVHNIAKNPNFIYANRVLPYTSTVSMDCFHDWYYDLAFYHLTNQSSINFSAYEKVVIGRSTDIVGGMYAEVKDIIDPSIRDSARSVWQIHTIQEVSVLELGSSLKNTWVTFSCDVKTSLKNVHIGIYRKGPAAATPDDPVSFFGDYTHPGDGLTHRLWATAKLENNLSDSVYVATYITCGSINPYDFTTGGTIRLFDFGNVSFVRGSYSNLLFVGNNNILTSDVYQDILDPKISDTSKNLQQYLQSMIPKGYINGFKLAWTNNTNAWGITVAEGRCIDNDGTLMMDSGGVYIKKIVDAAGTDFVDFVAGSAQGAVWSGATIADGLWLHIFAIHQTYAGVVSYPVDIFADEDADCLHIPAGYSYYRRIGSICIVDVGGAKFGIKKFVQRGDEFFWQRYKSDVISQIFAGDHLLAVQVPMGINTLARVSAVNYTTVAPGESLRISSPLHSANDGENELESNATPNDGFYQVLTDTSSQIAYKEASGVGTSSVAFTCSSYVDFRGKDLT